jgi:hypothetical protein
MQYRRGALPAAFVLQAESANQLGVLTGLLEPREDVFFFLLLVVLLDEAPDQPRGAGKHFGREIIAGVEPAYRLAVD